MARLPIARDRPDSTDVHVGIRVRLRRTLLGMNQSQLGSALGVASQQVRNYERGTDSISASRLWQLTEIVDVPLSLTSSTDLVTEPRRCRRMTCCLRARPLGCFSPITASATRRRG